MYLSYSEMVALATDYVNGDEDEEHIYTLLEWGIVTYDDLRLFPTSFTGVYRVNKIDSITKDILHGDLTREDMIHLRDAKVINLVVGQ